MIEPLAFATTVVCGLGAFAVLAAGLAGRYRHRPMLLALLAVEIVLVVQAIADVTGLLGGHRPTEPGTHLAYLAASLLVLPAAGFWGARDEDRWAAAVVVVALLALVVLTIRLQTTWR